MPDREEQPIPKGKATLVTRETTVTIFGGGITGLSAAHELIERGFRVHVWEPADNDRELAAGCDIGGMARTQWGATNWTTPVDGSLPDEASGAAPASAEAKAEERWRKRSTHPIVDVPWVLFLGKGPNYNIEAAAGYGAFATTPNGVDAVLSEMLEFLCTKEGGPDLYCEVQRRSVTNRKGESRAEEIIDKLNERFRGRKTGLFLSGPKPIADYRELALVEATLERPGKEPKNGKFYLAQLDGFPSDVPEDYHLRISFRLGERWLPGEHGFRFFPRFYYHLFDTMRRTPILEQATKPELSAAHERAVSVNASPTKFVETGRTVFDNLRPTEMQALAFTAGGAPAVLPRRAVRSLKDVRHWLSVIFGKAGTVGLNGVGRDGKESKTEEGGYGLTHRDAARFAVKMFQYMTSCEERRAEYGLMSWLEYLGGPKVYSDAFVKLVNDSPKALVAMDAKMSDARTQGSIFTQLLLDNTEEEGFRDGTLNGPTSVAWLAHWRRYLEAQGVEFIHGEIEDFEVCISPESNDEVVWPKVKCYEPRYPGALTGSPELLPGYFVLALPPLVAQKMARKYRDATTGRTQNGDFLRLCKMKLVSDPSELDPSGTAIVAESPQGAMQHMVGIQYYFGADAFGVDGHYYLPLSPWGLSAISQARFWQEKADWEHGYRGLLSVCIGKLDTPATEGGKDTAWKSNRAALAMGAWYQVAAALSPAGANRVPEPNYWHLDTNLVFGNLGSGEAAFANRSPLLINLPGAWEDRPGEIAAPSTFDWRDSAPGYDVTDWLVLAGNYTKTFTRLTTMEAANESARHAVNAILRHSAQRRKVRPSQPCEIWPLEDREVDDFDFLKELDAALYRDGLDHMLEILEVPDLVGNTFRGTTTDRTDPNDPLAILGQLDDLLKKYGAPLLSFIQDTVKPAEVKL